MRIIFIGYAVPQSDAVLYSGLSIAGNKMQNGFLSGLMEYDLDIKCLTIAPLAPFPKDRNFFFKKTKRILDSGLQVTLTPYINLPVLKQFTQTLFILIELLKLCKKEEIDVIITFNTFPQVGLPALLISNIRKVKFIPFVADLPIDDAISRKFFSRLARKLFDRLATFALNHCQKLIVLNKYAAEKYAAGKEYMVLDGGIQDSDLNRYCKLGTDIKNIVYTGALTNYSGIKNLIAAVNEIRNFEIYLDIYGSGDLEDEISKIALNNKRVRFFGKMPHEYVLNQQSNAWLLVNPRSVSDSIGKVTFPSKIFEYLMSGTPVLSTKLNCFSDEYKDIMFFCENNDPQTIANAIIKIMRTNPNQLREISQKAYFFVLKEKRWGAHANNVIKFISE